MTESKGIILFSFCVSHHNHFLKLKNFHTFVPHMKRSGSISLKKETSINMVECVIVPPYSDTESWS